MECDNTATMNLILLFPWWKNADFLWNNILIVEYFHGTNMINFCGLHLLKITTTAIWQVTSKIYFPYEISYSHVLDQYLHLNANLKYRYIYVCVCVCVICWKYSTWNVISVTCVICRFGPGMTKQPHCTTSVSSLRHNTKQNTSGRYLIISFLNGIQKCWPIRSRRLESVCAIDHILIQ